MSAAKIEEAYRRWWVGKKCRRLFSQNEFRLVKDIVLYGPPSLFNCVVELVYEDGTVETVSMGSNAHRPTKQDVEVETD